MLDCIIIGSGAAGVSAALTLKSHNRTFIMLGQAGLSEKISKAERIVNYAGLSAVTGQEFVGALQRQLREADIAVQEERAMGIYSMQGKLGVATQEGGYYESKTVILASGVEGVKTIDGETEFMGRGVSYCATCDGFLYKDKRIAVICTTKRAEHEIELLADFAKEVYLVAMYKDVEVERENVRVIKKMPIKIDGGKRVEKLVFPSPIDGESKELLVDGVFMLRESVSPATLIAELIIKDGHVVVDRQMQTNVAGLFVAGDCTGKPYQYAKAVGEGNVAAHSVGAYLANLKQVEK